jgi:hypothetical protein
MGTLSEWMSYNGPVHGCRPASKYAVVTFDGALEFDEMFLIAVWMVTVSMELLLWLCDDQ